jgi:hypothetical protein
MAVRRACAGAARHSPRMITARLDATKELATAFAFMVLTPHNSFFPNAMLAECSLFVPELSQSTLEIEGNVTTSGASR